MSESNNPTHNYVPQWDDFYDINGLQSMEHLNTSFSRDPSTNNPYLIPAPTQMFPDSDFSQRFDRQPNPYHNRDFPPSTFINSVNNENTGYRSNPPDSDILNPPNQVNNGPTETHLHHVCAINNRSTSTSYSITPIPTQANDINESASSGYFLVTKVEKTQSVVSAADFNKLLATTPL